MKDRLEQCRQCNECPNCFARTKDNFCTILNNTDFLGAECPFYRTKEKQMAELKKYPYIPPVSYKRGA